MRFRNRGLRFSANKTFRPASPIRVAFLQVSWSIDSAMYPHVTYAPNFSNNLWIAVFGLAIAMLMACQNAHGQDAGIDGFTEPFKKIDLASDESGAINQLNFEAGDRVTQGDVVAQLDARVQQLQLEVATQLADAKSQLIAAEKTHEKRKSILARLQSLRDKGHASESEIIRAEMELSIAEAKWLSAKEDLAVREVEKRRAQVQLDRRAIKAPFNGVVAKVLRREGEFLSPLHPEVVTIVQVDRLLATFNVPSSQVSMFELGREFSIEIGNGRSVQAKVYRVGVETDAKSSTVEIKLVIENPDFSLRSGESCLLKI